MQFPIFIELRRSAFLGSVLAVMGALATGSVLATPLAWYFRLGLLLCVALAIAMALRKPAVARLRLLGCARMELELADGRVQEVSVHEGTTVFSHLIVLRARLEDEPGKVISLAIFPGQIPPDKHRQLRLWLRLQNQ